MSGENGKPIHLTQGERKLVIKALEAMIETWTEAQEGADKFNKNLAKLRCRQYGRIIRECREADPEPKSQ